MKQTKGTAKNNSLCISPPELLKQASRSISAFSAGTEVAVHRFEQAASKRLLTLPQSRFAKHQRLDRQKKYSRDRYRVKQISVPARNKLLSREQEHPQNWPQPDPSSQREYQTSTRHRTRDYR
jgi:hypothetical protein